MKLRTGRHNDRIVYLQRGDEPSDLDPMIAVFFSAGTASEIVWRMNAEYEGLSFWEDLDD